MENVHLYGISQLAIFDPDGKYMFLRGTALPKSVSCECFLADVRKDERPETSRLLKWCLRPWNPWILAKKKRTFLAFLFPVSTKSGNHRIQHLSIEFGIHVCINHVSSCVHPLVCRLYQIVHLSSCQSGIMIFTWGITYPSSRCMLRLRTGTKKKTGRLVASSLERTRPVTFIGGHPVRFSMEEFWGHPVPNHRKYFSI